MSAQALIKLPVCPEMIFDFHTTIVRKNLTYLAYISVSHADVNVDENVSVPFLCFNSYLPVSGAASF